MASTAMNIFDNLKIEDPIGSYCWFINERLQIYINKEKGLPQPWTDDKVLQTAKICNTFRVLDKTTKHILKFLEPVKNSDELLFLNAIWVRTANKIETIDHIGLLDYNIGNEFLDNIRKLKTKWGAAYQYPVNFKKSYDINNREEFFLDVLVPMSKLMLKEIKEKKETDLTKIIEIMNSKTKFKVTFAFMQSILDISELRPDLVNPNGHLPIGPGSKPALKFLGFLENDYHQAIEELGTEVNNRYPNIPTMRPQDVEGGLCEWRKWLTYTHGIRKIRIRYNAKGFDSRKQPSKEERNTQKLNTSKTI